MPHYGEKHICLLQVAKNVVLAGAGVVTLMDNTAVREMVAASFLVPQDAEGTQRYPRTFSLPECNWVVVSSKATYSVPCR